ncbi:GNAT family N-acetyltransferase [Pseudomonas sp. NPDC088444]|uniref:GNAT family N-acetyltransferase n=1 Tax=Pseudomonas sp. NPDC088444 TaxID=3364456 RepID=UPI00384F184E
MSIDTRALIIRTSRLSIRPFCETDAVESYDSLTTLLTRNMSWEPPASREEYAQLWAQWLPAIADGSDIVFAIRQLDDASFLGLVGLHNVNDRTPELGIWIREDKHRRGFGKEAVGGLVQWASEHVAPSGFIYPVARENEPSRLIAEAFGGIATGTDSDIPELCELRRMIVINLSKAAAW